MVMSEAAFLFFFIQMHVAFVTLQGPLNKIQLAVVFMHAPLDNSQHKIHKCITTVQLLTPNTL